MNPDKTDPTIFKIDGGFTGDNPTTGYDFSALETNSAQTLQMVVTAIPLTQQACNTLLKVNPTSTARSALSTGMAEGRARMRRCCSR